MDDLATRCGTLAYRLDRPHSQYTDEAGAKHLREAAARIARLEAALEDIADGEYRLSYEALIRIARAALTEKET